MPESERAHPRGGFHLELHIHSYEEWLAFCAGIRGEKPLEPAEIAQFNANVTTVDQAGDALGGIAQQLGGIKTDPPAT